MTVRLHGLKPGSGANRKRRRVGRGPGTGRGKTAGRGHKGQRARAGFSRRAGFEGGQMPLYRRVPKRGFRNIFAKEFVILSVADLNRYPSGSTITPESLVKDGVVRKLRDGLRILGQGELTKKLTVKAHHFTNSARRKIESAGGSCEVIV